MHKLWSNEYFKLLFSSHNICFHIFIFWFSNSDVNLLHALSSRSTDCRFNFKNKYIHSDLYCQLCKKENEDQQHLLKCDVIVNNMHTEDIVTETVEYRDIFSNDDKKQKVITELFKRVFKLRDKLRENQNSQLAPSNSDELLMMSNNLQLCTVYLSSGK